MRRRVLLESSITVPCSGAPIHRLVHYHCTGFRGRCGNTYIPEEELSKLFEDVVRRVQIPTDVADAFAETLRSSQAEKERFHRTAVMQLQRR
jgi:site-specific DNA recombinase